MNCVQMGRTAHLIQLHSYQMRIYIHATYNCICQYIFISRRRPDVIALQVFEMQLSTNYRETSPEVHSTGEQTKWRLLDMLYEGQRPTDMGWGRLWTLAMLCVLSVYVSAYALRTTEFCITTMYRNTQAS